MNRLAALALAAALPAHACPGLVVEDAWIRAAPAGATMTAAYARLVNRGREPLVIDGASGDAFAGAELHRTVLENGRYRMTQQALTLAPGARAALEPGGWHLMLMRPSRPLAAGDAVLLALTCGKQGREFTFTVRAGA